MATDLSRQDAEALYQLFNEFALEDQRRYYRQSVEKSRDAAKQVNFIRALLAFLTGIASALAGLLVATGASNNPNTAVVVVIMLIIAVVAPVFGGAFGTLADLYQWDRLSAIYDTALRNIEVADALSPDKDDTDQMYQLALQAFSEGTLSVMTDETAQWGNLIRSPKAIEEFLAEQQQRAIAASQTPFSTPQSIPGPLPPTPPSGSGTSSSSGVG
ncbi:MAG: hypothetical protein KF726_12715 [Anaerolineae bacterium]|nr:hypothetical protein [Anaerolineae bacterium]